MAYAKPVFGETTELAATFSERNNNAFTISSALLYITSGAAVILSAAATVSGTSVSYIQAFTTAAGFKEGNEYNGVFKATISCGGQTYIEKHEDSFVVLAASDE